MNLKIVSISTEEKTLTPTLLVRVAYEYHYNLEIIAGISGRLMAEDGMLLATLTEYTTIQEMKMGVKPMEKQQRDKMYSGDRFKNFYEINLCAILTPAAVIHLEKLREKNHRKEVALSASFIVKCLLSPSSTQEAAIANSHDPLLRLDLIKEECQFIIAQGQWQRDFAEPLGIGSFILVEMKIPDPSGVAESWNDLFERLGIRVQEMRKAVQLQDWQRVMFAGRQFYENLKFQNKDPENLRETLKQFFIHAQYSEEGFNELMNGVHHFFQYCSKFLHDKSTGGTLNPIPIPSREDAHFIYTQALGLLNVIKQKISV
jgi:hypothetical protein